jgi:photosystem II stability/assembly factor-like uncharacterized protein
MNPSWLEFAKLLGHSEGKGKSGGNEGGEEDSSFISDRAQWFTTRAGNSTDSTSFTRLLMALDSAFDTPSDPRETLKIGPVVETYYYNLLHGNDLPFVLHIDGSNYNPKEEEAPVPRAFGAFGPVLRVDAVMAPYSMLALPIRPDQVSGFDLGSALFSFWQKDKQIVSIIESSKYLAGDGLLIGRITTPGLYQAVALPRNTFIDTGLRLIAQSWSLARVNLGMNAERFDAGQYPGTLNLLRQISADLARQNAPEQMGEPATQADGQSRSAVNIFALFFAFVLDLISKLESSTLDLAAEPPALKLWRSKQYDNYSWECVGPSLNRDVQTIGRVTKLDVHPRDGKTVIAASAGGGVWLTDDCGLHWRALMQDEPTLTMGAVAFAPSDSQLIYAASGEDAGADSPAWPGAGVYRSEDGGNNWAAAAKVTSTRFSAIAVHPHDPFTLFVAGNRGLHKSTDGGRSWIINPGETSLLDGHVTDVVLDYDQTDNVYIGVYNVGILRSTTGGQSRGGATAFRQCDDARLPSGYDARWVKLAIGRKGKSRSKFLAAKLGRLGERIFVTTDGGSTWCEKKSVLASRTSEWASVIAVDPMDESQLFAGARDGLIAYSNNGGGSWSFLPITGTLFSDQQDLVFDCGNSDRIYLANDAGVYVTTNKGLSWQFASGDLEITQVYDLDVVEKDAEVIACGAQDTGFFYRNSDGVWRQVASGDVTQVAIDPANPELVYFVGPHAVAKSSFAFQDFGGHCVRTFSPTGLEGDSPWVTILKLNPDPNIANPCEERELFLCGEYMLFYSCDSGRTFQRVNYKSGCPFITDGEITALEYSPTKPSVLYLGTSKGVIYKTSNGGKFGEDWQPRHINSELEPPRAPISSFSIDWGDPDYVWLVFAGNGVTRLGPPDDDLTGCKNKHAFKTIDGGKHWANASGKFPRMFLPDVPVCAVAIDSFDRNSVYVGTDVGVFRTSDGGDTWTAFQDGLPRSPVTELRLNKTNRFLFAATMGRGVYRRRLE